MKNRKETLLSLIWYKTNLNEIREDLKKYKWDSKDELVIVDRIIIDAIMKRYIDMEISQENLIDRANIIEWRDDIGFSSDEIQELIFTIANPVLNGDFSLEMAKELIQLWNI